MRIGPDNKITGGLDIRVRGLVQGVGFRPFVWRLAHECKLAGHVLNDGAGVAIQIRGDGRRLDEFLRRLESDAPPLSRIDNVESHDLGAASSDPHFHIRDSLEGSVRTGVVPDAAICPDCLADIEDPANRRYRYPFTNCTHCGPRLSIIRAIPYDRANTSMADFTMCAPCEEEYGDPADRRFHAQPNACGDCGPQVWLEEKAGRKIKPGSGEDAIASACRLISQGFIVAIKGIGGFHLACDAANNEAVRALRERKHRFEKPFALMARDARMVGEYARLDEKSRACLEDKAAPVVILPIKSNAPPLAAGIAPGQNTLGFMLPYTPLHHILLQGLERPIVMTSGNRSDEPQCIANDEARAHLASIADYWLMHDRDIVNRLDDSVVRVVDRQVRLLRRARGYAPAPINLPPGFAAAPKVLAMGAELKNTFCLIQEGQAILSAHMGDLEDAATHGEYRNALKLYRQLFAFEPEIIGTDMHPDYHSTQWGEGIAAEGNLPCEKVQHHHAHIAACMAERGMNIDAAPVLGIALDGLGFGDDGQLWGGEFLLADYKNFERLAHFAPVALPGGEKAMREPWRNAYAHLDAALGWALVCADYPTLPIIRYLNAKPLHALDTMMRRGLNSPAASSAGRLFDAVAAVLGLRRDAVSYEGQAAIELEVLASEYAAGAAGHYEVDIDDKGPVVVSWGPMWHGILDDLGQGAEAALVAARFHNTLAVAIARVAVLCARRRAFESIILTGGVFQNRLLLESLSHLLRKQGYDVLSPSQTPANDGGIALGQAVITAARQLEGMNT